MLRINHMHFRSLVIKYRRLTSFTSGNDITGSVKYCVMWQIECSPVPRELTFLGFGLRIDYIADICYVLVSNYM